jgi:hypothetical protein
VLCLRVLTYLLTLLSCLLLPWLPCCLCAPPQGVPNNYETDLIFPIVAKAAELAGIDYAAAHPAAQTALKVRTTAEAAAATLASFVHESIAAGCLTTTAESSCRGVSCVCGYWSPSQIAQLAACTDGTQGAHDRASCSSDWQAFNARHMSSVAAGLLNNNS